MNDALVLLVVILGVVTMVFYSIVAPWEKSRQGRAYFLLFLSMTMIAVHFALESAFGQSPYSVETLLLVFVAGSIAWNLWTMLSKKFGRRAHKRARLRK